jgi:hypothetical protein
VITSNIYLHACDSQLNSALPKGLLAMPAVSPIPGGFGMPSFVGRLRVVNTNIHGGFNTPSHVELRLLEAFIASGHGDSAPICQTIDKEVAEWQAQGSDTRITKHSTFNTLYNGKYNSHSVGLYRLAEAPPNRCKA